MDAAFKLPDIDFGISARTTLAAGFDMVNQASGRRDAYQTVDQSGLGEVRFKREAGET